MRNKLILLLAAALLGKITTPAAAQVPETWVAGLPSGTPSTSAKTWLECTSGEAFALVLWLANTGCQDSGVGEQGPIARALGLPVAAKERRDAALAINAGCDVKPGAFSCVSFADPFRSDTPVCIQAVNNGLGAGTFCECPIGDILGLPPADAAFTTDACVIPRCALDGNGANNPCVQWNGGASVSFITAFSSNGLNGHQNLNQYQGAGTSMWLGCTTESGLEVRIGFSFIAGYQVR